MKRMATIGTGVDPTGRYRRDVTVRPALQRWHRNSVVVLTALIAVLAMHGLTSDHGMGMPRMRVTAGPVMASSVHGVTDPHDVMSAIPAALANQLDSVAAAGSAVAAADAHMGHAAGMCVGILGIALLLCLIARSRRNSRHRVVPFAFTSAARAIQARAGPLPPLLRPSLVKLGISRT